MSNITQVTKKKRRPKTIQINRLDTIEKTLKKPSSYKRATQKNNYCVSAVFYLASIAPSLVEFISMNLYVAILREDGNI